MAGRPNYLVYAPVFDPNSGGAIFLHELVHALNELGEQAYIWPFGKAPPPSLLRRYLRKPSLLWKKPAVPLYGTNPDLNTPVASDSDFRANSIIVYPEITLDNPLGLTNVVRWLLYFPGGLAPYSFGDNEMFFRAGEMSDMLELTGGAPDLYVWRANPAYRNEERADRKGACYIVRKGDKTPRIAETEVETAIQIDGLGHDEIADIFNRCEIFYSYDEATFYSQYAAICGCVSVVIPSMYGSRDEWVSNHPLGKYGVAYGLDDLDHARATGSLVKGFLEAKEEQGRETVRNFVTLTQERFGARNG